MSIDVLLTNLWRSAAFIAAIGTLIGIYVSRRNGVQGDERAARAQEIEGKRDTVADRDALIDQLQEDVRDVRERVVHLEKSLALRDRWLAAEREYSRQLLDWGYRGAPPPPPARPDTGPLS